MTAVGPSSSTPQAASTGRPSGSCTVAVSRCPRRRRQDRVHGARAAVGHGREVEIGVGQGASQAGGDSVGGLAGGEASLELLRADEDSHADLLVVAMIFPTEAGGNIARGLDNRTYMLLLWRSRTHVLFRRITR